MNGGGGGETEHLRAEEAEEVAKHAELYRMEDAEALRMKPWDWEKFATAEPLCAYRASILALGDLRSVEILDAGCGDGWLSVILAKLGAHVTAFDVSPEGIERARARVQVNGVQDRVDLHCASFYDMPFPAGRFSLVIGQAILHHLRDKDAAARELHRVMQPGGRAIFVECLGRSQVLERLRLLVPVPSAAPEDPEHWKDQITDRDLAQLASHFEVQTSEFQLFSRLTRILHSKGFTEWIGRVDARVLQVVPPLRRYARTILIELKKPV